MSAVFCVRSFLKVSNVDRALDVVISIIIILLYSAFGLSSDLCRSFPDPFYSCYSIHFIAIITMDIAISPSSSQASLLCMKRSEHRN
eukprot:706312-Pleurochrysis_carterae.AAC.1